MVNTSYDLLEKDIIAKLIELKEAGVEVIQTPETDAELNEIGKAFEVPRITVTYLLSLFDNQPIKGIPTSYSMGVVTQKEFAEVILNFQTRKLRGAGGLYAMYESARKLLMGHEPEGWGKLYLKDFILVERDEQTNVWFYALTIITQREIIDCSKDNLNLTNSTNTGLIEIEPTEPNLEEIILSESLT